MKQTTKRLASSFVSLALLAGSFMVFFWFVRPAYGDAEKIRAEVASRQQFIDAQRAVVNQVKTLMAAYESAQELRDHISLTIPLAPDVGVALTQLNGILMKNGLAPHSFSVSAGANQAPDLKSAGKERAPGLVRPYGSVHIQTRFTGSYENFREYMKDMETNIRLFNVKTIALQPAGKPTQDLYAFDMGVVAYYQNE